MTDPKRVPHKHAAVIKAWAYGAEIEVNVSGRWLPVRSPQWKLHLEYRVKPEPVPHPQQELLDAFRNGATDIEAQLPSGEWTNCKNLGSWIMHDPLPQPECVKLRRALEWQTERDAFAAGKPIQCRSHVKHDWRDVASPSWCSLKHGYEYRIKPELVVRYAQAFLCGSENLLHIVQRTLLDDGTNLKLTFEDDKLVKAEVLS